MDNQLNVVSKSKNAKSPEQRLNDLQKRKQELIEKERRLKSRITQDERKKRTKRLIEIGATVESVLGKPIEKDDLIKLKSFLENQEKRGKYFSDAMKENNA